MTYSMLRILRALLVGCLVVTFCGDYSHRTNVFAGHQRVLLLTAHPDDECMFFAPTVLHLIQAAVTLYSLCLSVGGLVAVKLLWKNSHGVVHPGDADGLGSIREKELSRSLQVLGVPSERSQIVNHHLLQDNFTQYWDRDVVADVVKPYIISRNISIILTFDDFGVSQHPNHISLLNGISHLLKTDPVPSARLFTLKTVSLPHKYIGPASNPLTKFGLLLPWTPRGTSTFIAGLGSYFTALHAMYQHQSQLVWFRWLYVLFSRYMWVNEWVEVQVHTR